MSAPIQEDQLLGRWVHSHEEDRGGSLVYRRAGYAFPPSRGRRAFTLEQQGALKTDAPGPDDRGQQVSGRWRFDGDRLTLESGGRTETFTIEWIDGDAVILKAFLARGGSGDTERMTRRNALAEQTKFTSGFCGRCPGMQMHAPRSRTGRSGSRTIRSSRGRRGCTKIPPSCTFCTTQTRRTSLVAQVQSQITVLTPGLP